MKNRGAGEGKRNKVPENWAPAA